jgi:hypothetical protein
MTREHGGCEHLKRARVLAAKRNLPIERVNQIAKLCCPKCPKDGGRCTIIESEDSIKALRQEALTKLY